MMMEDEFEKREMHDGSRIVHRDKKVSRRMASVLAMGGLVPIAVGILVAIMNGTSSKPLPAAALPFVVAALTAMGLGFFVLAIAMAVVRTVVTKKAVHVKYGLWGPTVPLEAIKSCTVVEYDWQEFGGWGIRHGRDGARAYVPASGPVVELIVREGGGERRILIGVDDAATTATAINRVRASEQAHNLRIASAVEEETLTMEETMEDDVELEPGRRRGDAGTD